MRRTAIFFTQLALVSCVALELVPVPGAAFAACTDADGDGFFAETGCGTLVDCNDAADGTYPGAAESCDGTDDDCDGELDNDASCDRTCDLAEAGRQEILVSTGPQIAFSPSAVWSGSVYAVAWADNGPEEIYFSRLDAAGAKLGDDVRVTVDPGGSEDPSLVWNGSEYAIVWEDDRPGNLEVYFARLDDVGSKLGDDVRVTIAAGASADPRIVWTGAEYGVAWEDGRHGNNEIYFARLDTAGNLIDAEVRVTTDPGNSRKPSLAWTGTGYGLTWQDDRDGNFEIYFTRLDPAGVEIGDDVRLTVDDSYSVGPSILWTGTEYAVVWDDYRGPHGEIYLTRLDIDGNKLVADTCLTESELPSREATLAWTGSEYGMIWSHDVGDPDIGQNFEVHFRRLDATGAPIDGPLRVAIRDAEPSTRPRIVWTGAGFGVFWEEWGVNDIFFNAVRCNCIDADVDGITSCNDCDDDDNQVYPDAPQLCDGINNDCDDPAWPAVPGLEVDDDGDTITECQGDCDDSVATVYPGAPQLCDGINNDCDEPAWVPTDEADADADTYRVCHGDCDESSTHTYPGAPQLCDGINNDCDDAQWPTPPDDEADDDGDGFMICAGDCDDTLPLVNPVGVERCNAIDDDCDGWTDEDAAGEDTDGDNVHNLCDNCVDDSNPLQEDEDEDGWGDACDNCPFLANPEQGDFDSDNEGDRCDVDDGRMHLRFDDPDWLTWEQEIGFETWNQYRGDLVVLRETGIVTQVPGSSYLVERRCGLTSTAVQDTDPLDPGGCAFYLVTGVAAGTESSLGPDSEGNPRPNHNPCPPE